MTFLRRILFYLFSLIFIIGCPVIILYALGYIVRPVESGGIVQTGLVYLSTTPAGASVYLWKKRYHEKTPTILRDLLPGEYMLRLGLKRYRAWQRMIKVEAGKATVLDKVLLVPGVLQPVRLSEENFKELIPVSGTNFIVLKKGPTAQDLYMFSLNQKSVAPIFPRQFYYKEAKVSRIFTVPGSPFLVVQLKLDKKTRFYWIQLDEEKLQFKLLDNLLEKEPEALKWDPKTAMHLFSLQGNDVSQVDLRYEKVYPKFFKQTRGFEVAGNSAYALTENGVVRSGFKGLQRISVLKNGPLFLKLFGTKGFFDVRLFPNGIILFTNKKGKLVGNRLPYLFADSDISGFEYYSKTQKLLLWSESQLGILDFSEELRKNALFERGPQVEWFFTDGEKIKQAFWVYDDSHVLFRDKDEVYLFELWLGAEGKVERFVTVRKNTDVYYSEETGFLYYLHPETEQLYGIEILPKKEIPILELSEFAAQRALPPRVTQREQT